MASAPQHDPREESQRNHERAMSEVSDVLLNIDQSIARTMKARKRLGTSAEEHNAHLALGETLTALHQLRKRLERDTLFSGDELRLV